MNLNISINSIINSIKKTRNKIYIPKWRGSNIKKKRKTLNF